MRERIESKINYWEWKKVWFEKKVEEKKEILAGVLNKYDKGEAKYELVEKCSRDLSIKIDMLNLIEETLRDLYELKMESE